jgi:salicylate hydroxylase
VIPTEKLERETPKFCAKINPRQPFTSMMMAHSCRLIMGPARESSMYSIVGLVPDDRMNEDVDSKQSWVSTGDLGRMLETFKDFPEWMQDVFKLTDDLGLWQLRDIDPLTTWTKGKVILIGDAAHAMLPTQGQGASQALEDAEALGAFFEGFGQSSQRTENVEEILEKVFQCRYERASLIQRYSRDAAKPATAADNKVVTM